MPIPQIIALGGGGFSMEASPLLDDYILQASGRPRPRICFLGTASGDSEGYRLRFYRRFGKADCRASDLQLFKREIIDLEDFLCSQDIVYVGGGNTANMLAIWALHGVDRALRRAWQAGTLLTGLSAGAICWFESGVTDSFGGELAALPCLGFLPGSACPHYDGEAERRPSYQRLLATGMPDGYAADDGAAMHFHQRELYRCIASRPGARVYRLEKRSVSVSEEALATEFLGDERIRVDP